MQNPSPPAPLPWKGRGEKVKKENQSPLSDVTKLRAGEQRMDQRGDRCFFGTLRL